ncbi:diversity-generating retroelement protein Avd [Patescibacteria group bacterium]|nr:diversity-generating retroelement protein Avd [Patescibacteria group bacterium]
MKNFPSFNPPPSLPVISRTITIYKLWHEFLLNFPKGSRYSLGIKIDNLIIETVELILTASRLPKNQKLPYLQKANSKLDLLKFFLQLAWEIKSLDDRKYIILSEHLNEIGRMLGGWQRQLSN